MKQSIIQQQVLDTLARIPTGRVSTYGDIALKAGLPGYARHVGHVLRNLPKDTRLPWHRVIRGTGEIALPPGSPSFIEQVRRLEAEGVRVASGRVNLAEYRW